jgi:hypothetical protein
VLTVNLVHSTTPTPTDPNKIDRIKDFGVFEDANLSYKVLKSILSTAYETFRIFHGKMDDIVVKSGVDSLRHTLDMFFARYLPTLSFYSPINTATANIFNILDGIQFLPVDPTVFLAVQSFMNQTTNFFNKRAPLIARQARHSPLVNAHIKENKPQVPKQTIRATMFFFDHYLLFSGGISHEEARIITNYMPVLLEDRFKEMQTGISSKRALFSIAKNDGYLTGPENINNKETRFTAPRVILGESGKKQESHIIVFKHQRISVLFFISPSVFSKIKFYTTMADIINPELTKLLSMISEGINYIPSFDDAYKYIYFNHMNLAIKTSLAKKHSIVPIDENAQAESEGLNSNSVTVRETLQTIAHIHTQFQK